MLILVFRLVRLIFFKISKIDIFLAWPILFIIFLRLSFHGLYPFLLYSVLPIASALIISTGLVVLTYRGKISFLNYSLYSFCVFIFYLIFIQGNIFVFLLIINVPLVLLFKKKIFGSVFLLILGSIFLFGLIFGVSPFSSRTSSIRINNKTPQSHENRNVILIIIDTARKDCINLEGKSSVTPSLKKLAENGIIINKFIANGAWTPPAHASFFTGLLVSDHGVFHYNNAYGWTSLSDELLTLAEILQRNGINTVGFTANPTIKEEFGFGQGFNQYSYLSDNFFSVIIEIFANNLKSLMKYFPRYFSGYRYLLENNYNSLALSDEVLTEAQKWISNNSSEKNFFLFINLMEQHYIRYFFDPIEEKFQIGPRYYFESKEKLYRKPETMKERNKILLNWHKTTIKYVDYYLGRFFEKLKDQGIYENTTIIVTSDHGNLFGEWAHYDHQDSIYAPNIFVPFIVKYADSFQERKVDRERIFQQVDIFAEILDLYNIQIPPYVYGAPFNIKKGNPVISQLYRIYEDFKWILKNDLCGTCLNLNGDFYQLIYSSDGKHELYRIHDFDFVEIDNLYEEFKENSRVLNFIEKCPKLMQRRIYKTDSVNHADILQKLKSLGYIMNSSDPVH